MDAVLAKLLNSTVGTSDYKSLDKLFEDLLDDNKSLIASDEVYYTFPSEFNTMSNITTNVEKNVVSFALPYSGSVNLFYRLGIGQSSSSDGVYLKVYKNDELVATVYHDVKNAFSNASDSTYLLQGNKGDVFRLAVVTSQTYHQAWMTLYSIKATLLQGKAFTPTSLL